MKKAIITLAAGLLFSSLSMALSTPGSASDAPVQLPCGKWAINSNVKINDKSTNFYAQMLAKSSGSTSLSKPGKSAN